MTWEVQLSRTVGCKFPKAECSDGHPQAKANCTLDMVKAECGDTQVALHKLVVATTTPTPTPPSAPGLKLEPAENQKSDLTRKGVKGLCFIDRRAKLAVTQK
jgi:hypothetical protein